MQVTEETPPERITLLGHEYVRADIAGEVPRAYTARELASAAHVDVTRVNRLMARDVIPWVVRAGTTKPKLVPREVGDMWLNGEVIPDEWRVRCNQARAAAVG